MKKTLLALTMFLTATALFSQTKSLPSANIKTLEGQTINAQDLGKSGKITVISFWATWCSPCKKELDAIKDYYDEWKEKYGIELIAISVDDARSAAKVPAMVQEKGWGYRVLLDPAKELQTAANIQAVPHTFVLDKKGNIVFEHNGYTPGDELELEDLFKQLTK